MTQIINVEPLDITYSGHYDHRKGFTIKLSKLLTELKEEGYSISNNKLRKRIRWIVRAIPWFNFQSWRFDHFQYWVIKKVLSIHYDSNRKVTNHKDIVREILQIRATEYTTEAYNNETEPTSARIRLNSCSVRPAIKQITGC